MRGRAIFTLTLGIVLAGAAVYLVEQRLNNRSEEGPVAAEPAIVLSRVVVAARELRYGDKVRGEFLREVEWPAGAEPEGAFHSIAEILGDGSEERIVLRTMSPGEPVLASKVSGFGAKATLATKLADNKRAYSIRINDVSGVAGFILPGDRVDIMLTRQVGDDGDNLVTDLILQNIVVLGIDQLTDEEREQPVLARTATVEVTPEQAQKLALAMQVGTLSLALRNIATADQTTARRVAVSDLYTQTPRPVTPRKPSVRIRRATDISVHTVDR